MPTALEDLRIGEVSGVDHPAHTEEGWMVLKAAGASPEAIEAIELVEALVDAVEKAARLDPDLLGRVGAEVLDESQRAVIKALGSPTTKATKEAHDMPDFDKSQLSEEALAYVESIEAERDQAVAKAADADPDPEATALAKAMDGLPEPIRKHLQAQADEVRKAREDAERERDIRLNAEYLQKARGFSALNEKPEELAPTLRKLADLDANLYVEVERLLKAANAQVSEASDVLFKSLGAAAPAPAGSAREQLDSFAKAAIEADPNLDYPTALAKVAEEHPDLYSEHRREQLAGSQEG